MTLVHGHLCSKDNFLYSYEFIFVRAKAYFFGMCQTGFPLCIRVCPMEMIMSLMIAMLFQIFTQNTFWYWSHFIAKVCTGFVQCHRIKRCQHSYVGNNRDVIF